MDSRGIPRRHTVFRRPRRRRLHRVPEGSVRRAGEGTVRKTGRPDHARGSEHRRLCNHARRRLRRVRGHTLLTHLYVDDVDAAYERAVKAGGESLREPQGQFYGDRSAGIKDRFGNQWWLATHVEDVSMEEMQRRQATMA